MRAAVGTDRDARVRRADLHVKVAIAHGVANLVVSTAGTEHGEGPRVGDMARKSKASCHVDHVLLGDTAVEKLVRVFGRGSGELLGSGGTGEVGVDRDDGHTLLREFGERRTEGGASREFLFGHFGACELNHGKPPHHAPLQARRARLQAARRTAPCRASQPRSP